MALTIITTGPNTGAPISIGDCKINFADITADNSYPTGGYAVTPDQIGFNTLIYALTISSTPQGYIPCWNTATQKVQFFQGSASGALPEVNNAVDLHTVTARVIFWGV